MRATERATRAGSSGSCHVGLPVLTLQKPQRRVQVSPRIMNVAVPRSQHSPMFGQAASWQTVWRSSLRIMSVSSRYFGPPGSGTLNHGGLRPRNGSTVPPSTFATSIPPGLARERVWWMRSGVSLTSAEGTDGLPSRLARRRSWRRRGHDGVLHAESPQRDEALPAAEGIAEGERHAPPEAGEPVGAALLGDGGHPHARQAAGHHPAERREVVVDVDREAVGRYAAGQVHADRGDLAVLHPHAGVVAALRLAGAGLDAGLAERADDRALHRAQEDEHVVHAHDRVAHELAGPVVGQLASPRRPHHVDALGAAPLLSHRQVTRRRAAPARLCRQVLEHRYKVAQLTGLHARPYARLWSEALLV